MRTILMRTSLLTPILLALLFVAAGNAFGQAPDPNVLYQIKARHSGKCLEVNGGPGATGDGALVVQRDCNNAENQQWMFTSIDGAGLYKIIAKHSGKGLDVFGGVFSAANNVIIEQHDYNGSANQMWSVNDLHNGYYSIIARHSGKSLDIRGASTDNGTQAIQWDFKWGYNQQWKLAPLAPCPQK
jgi:ricin-type beta-trefoil lectin protein